MAFTDRHDAERVMRALSRRFAKYGLTVHAGKTQLLRFFPQDAGVGPASQNGSFQFLGFTHFWGRSRRGNPIVKRKTASDRLTRALQAVSVWCKQHRHVSLLEQQIALRRKLLGHYAYFGITGNARGLGELPPRDAANLAQVAGSTRREAFYLVPVRSDVGALPIAGGARGSLRVRSKP